MRIKLVLKTRDKYLTARYNYPFSGAIYKTLGFGSPEFAEFLHDVGYIEKGKNYKLFNWALKLNKIKPQKDIFKLENPFATLIVSSPLIDDFLQGFVFGSFGNSEINILYHGIRTRFEIESIDTLDEPEFSDKMKFRLVSPMVLSTKTDENSKPYYYRFNDDITQINKVFNQNLKNKFRLITNNYYNNEDLLFEWDKEYIEKTKEERRLTSLIKVQAQGKPEISIKANRLPFTVTGPAELIKAGYYAGFGSHNSLGCGMAKVIK